MTRMTSVTFLDELILHVYTENNSLTHVQLQRCFWSEYQMFIKRSEILVNQATVHFQSSSFPLETLSLSLLLPLDDCLRPLRAGVALLSNSSFSSFTFCPSISSMASASSRSWNHMNNQMDTKSNTALTQCTCTTSCIIIQNVNVRNTV